MLDRNFKLLIGLGILRTQSTAPVSNVLMFWPCVSSWPAIAEYCCNAASWPAFSRAARVAEGRCLTRVPEVLLKNISIKAWRAVCGAAAVS